jgi:hypothetical protein
VRRLAVAGPHLRALGELDVRPLRRVQGVRPDEELRLGEDTAPRAESLDPAADEVDLVARDEPGRADVEDERTVGAQADLAAELLAGAARLALEPRVESRRPGQLDVLRRDAVELARLGRLQVVPDQQHLRRVSEEALVRQVVPAPHRKGRMDPEPAGGAQVVGVRRADRKQVREQEDVGPLPGQERLDVLRRSQTALHRLERVLQRGDAPRAERLGYAGHVPHRLRRLARGARAEARLLRIARLQVAQVVDAAPEPGGERDPAGVAHVRQLAELDAGTVVGEVLELAMGLDRLERLVAELEVVAAAVEDPERRHERPDARVLHHEQDLQRLPAGHGLDGSSGMFGAR